jgi:hypothetical protein
VDDGKDRKYKSLKKWHEDFEARLKALKDAIPDRSNNYQTELNRLKVLKKIADIDRKNKDEARNNLKHQSESRGENFMRRMEDMLNQAGGEGFKLTWRSVQCGLKHRRLFKCGLI